MERMTTVTPSTHEPTTVQHTTVTTKQTTVKTTRVPTTVTTSTTATPRRTTTPLTTERTTEAPVANATMSFQTKLIITSMAFMGLIPGSALWGYFIFIVGRKKAFNYERKAEKDTVAMDETVRQCSVKTNQTTVIGGEQCDSIDESKDGGDILKAGRNTGQQWDIETQDNNGDNLTRVEIEQEKLKANVAEEEKAEKRVNGDAPAVIELKDGVDEKNPTIEPLDSPASVIPEGGGTNDLSGDNTNRNVTDHDNQSERQDVVGNADGDNEFSSNEDGGSGEVKNLDSVDKECIQGPKDQDETVDDVNKASNDEHCVIEDTGDGVKYDNVSDNGDASGIMKKDVSIEDEVVQKVEDREEVLVNENDNKDGMNGSIGGNKEDNIKGDTGENVNNNNRTEEAVDAVNNDSNDTIEDTGLGMKNDNTSNNGDVIEIMKKDVSIEDEVVQNVEDRGLVNEGDNKDEINCCTGDNNEDNNVGEYVNNNNRDKDNDNECDKKVNMSNNGTNEDNTGDSQYCVDKDTSQVDSDQTTSNISDKNVTIEVGGGDDDDGNKNINDDETVTGDGEEETNNVLPQNEFVCDNEEHMTTSQIEENNDEEYKKENQTIVDEGEHTEQTDLGKYDGDRDGDTNGNGDDKKEQDKNAENEQAEGESSETESSKDMGDNYRFESDDKSETQVDPKERAGLVGSENVG
ncbi:uncharacterized protein LOC144356497 [Saccoglossus kowalevskii]